MYSLWFQHLLCHGAEFWTRDIICSFQYDNNVYKYPLQFFSQCSFMFVNYRIECSRWDYHCRIKLHVDGSMACRSVDERYCHILWVRVTCLLRERYYPSIKPHSVTPQGIVILSEFHITKNILQLTRYTITLEKPNFKEFLCYVSSSYSCSYFISSVEPRRQPNKVNSFNKKIDSLKSHNTNTEF